MITTTLTDLGNRNLPPLPDSNQNFSLHFGANLAEAEDIGLTFVSSEHDNQVVLGYGQANAPDCEFILHQVSFRFEVWDFTNLDPTVNANHLHAYGDEWRPEQGNFFWVVENDVGYKSRTTHTLMSAIGDLFFVLDQHAGRIHNSESCRD